MLNEGLCMHLSDVQSVLSDVYAADKVSNGGKIDSSAIAALVRKACTRRVRTSSQWIYPLVTHVLEAA